MLYDPKWEQPSLAGFIGFLVTKDPSEEYAWSRPAVCAVTQYFDTLSPTREQRYQWWDCHVGQAQQLDSLAMQRPHTFGALLERARAAAVAGDK